MVNSTVVMIAYQPLSLKGLRSHPVIRGHRVRTHPYLDSSADTISSCCLFLPVVGLYAHIITEMIEVLSNPQLLCPFLCPFHINLELPQVSQGILSVLPALTPNSSVAVAFSALVLLMGPVVGVEGGSPQSPIVYANKPGTGLLRSKFSPTYLCF